MCILETLFQQRLESSQVEKNELNSPPNEHQGT